MVIVHKDVILVACGENSPALLHLSVYQKKTRHILFVAFMVQHAKHTLNGCLSMHCILLQGVWNLCLHLSGVVSLYSSSSYGFKVCVLDFTTLILLLGEVLIVVW